MAKEKINKSGRTKPQVAAVCILLVLCLAAGAVLAYMFSESDKVSNQFTLAKVTCQVNNDNNTFDVTNTGDVDAYIRAAIVVNWMDGDGNVRGIAPVEVADFDMEKNLTDDGWMYDSATGYYYYKKPVAAGDSTELLIKRITENVTVPSGYQLSVEVVAEAIQAAGTTDPELDPDDDKEYPAVTDAWGVSVDPYTKYLTLN